ncbi:hypothetical protein [Glycomyces algeriensis]|uniref:DUF4190 domain-containing protein n=1 Tax=Glycomyces algeriensis TaxID=256037 RepID=A0A9W6G7R7_9ACTN|nr:hypothetical protein [Glycomyces algeriensis]MDA1366109.1 hypothetical protein [Glycomyces algeriensis]MDR7349123.1 hypothetical protein [Glycomyces algeriensis]GLI41823.1 hypothetical protein GALLR39Z86_16730 [Glycomyces algeriensis]
MAYPPAPAPMQQPTPVKQGNGFGVTALVLGLVGLIIFSWIPGVNLFTALPIAILAVIFGIVALAKAGSRGGKGKGTGGTGLVTGLLAIVVAIAVNVWIVNFFEEEADTIEQETVQDCVDSGAGTQEECQQIWDDAEDSVYGG